MHTCISLIHYYSLAGIISDYVSLLENLKAIIFLSINCQLGPKPPSLITLVHKHRFIGINFSYSNSHTMSHRLALVIHSH